LLSDRERALPTPHPKLHIAEAGAAPDKPWLAEIETWLSQPHSASDDEVKRELSSRVPEYRPAAAGSGLHGVQAKG